MVRKTGNIKISIILVLSITAVLVTGTVVNIVSAANSGVKVQPKTYQHPITSIGSTHIVPSAPRGSVKVQPKTNLVTSTRSPHNISAAHGTKCKSGPCPNGTWGSEFTALQYIHTKPGEYSFTGVLKGETFSGVFYGIKSGPVHFGVAYRDNHAPINGPLPTKTSWNGHPGEPGDGTFSGTFWACDDQPSKDHTAYFTAYFDGGRAVNIDTLFTDKPTNDYAYDYEGTTSLKDLGGNSRLLSIDMCPSAQPHFTDMHITSNPNYDFTFSGKLISAGGSPVGGTPINLLASYLDNKPGHVHEFHCLPDKNPTCTTVHEGEKSTVPPGTGILTYETTKADGTFSGSFAACDFSTGGGHTSDAQLTAEVNGGLPTGVWAFTTMPCSEHLGAHRVLPTIHHT